MKYNIMIVGPVGTGKTTALRTIVEDCGKELFVVATEPGIQNILGESATAGPLPKEKCHWHYISPAEIDWKVLETNAKLVNTMSMADLQKMPAANRNKFQQFVELLSVLANFKCDRTGEEYGPVDSWGEDRVLAIDGLSGISQMAMDLVVGSKPIKTQPEWGAAMDMILRLVRKLCYDTKCTFVMNAHLERQIDETGGGTHLTVSTLGNKLAPELIKPFDEIIFAKRVAEKFTWSTMEMQVDLKTRILGWGDSYEPTYKHFFKDEKAQKAA
jgi:hypothetical protein